MRIAVNWFETTLPSDTINVPMETVVGSDDESTTPNSRPRYSHRVIQRRDDGNICLYHLTDSPPETTSLAAVISSDDPSIVKAAIEEGFCQVLEQRGYDVHRKHVGAVAYFPTNDSLFPEVYTFMRGLSFRSFYGFGIGSSRFGLVLNFSTSQRFCLTLEDAELRNMAVHRRIVSVGTSEVADEMRSGILVGVDGESIRVDCGQEEPVYSTVSNWTIPCRRELLQEYVSRKHGPSEASKVMKSLQVHTCEITSNGRMNTSLAKDQMSAVKAILHEHDLMRFHLPLPDHPPLSVLDKPLFVGTT